MSEVPLHRGLARCSGMRASRSRCVETSAHFPVTRVKKKRRICDVAVVTAELLKEHDTLDLEQFWEMTIFTMTWGS